MRMPRFLIFTVFFLGLCLPTANAQEKPLPAYGTEIFRFLLHLNGVNPISSFQEYRENPQPQNTIIVCHGDTDWLNTMGEDFVAQFIKAGGAIVIASENPPSRFPNLRIPGWNESLGITISNQYVESPNESCYHQLGYQPYLVPMWKFAKVTPGTPHELFTETNNQGELSRVPSVGPNAIATSGPVDLLIYQQPTHRTLQTAVLSKYPAKSFYFLNNNRMAPLLQSNSSLVVSDTDSGGFLLLFGSRSLTDNSMLKGTPDPNQPQDIVFDNGNLGFQERLAKLLKTGSGGNRTKCLFVEEGRVIDKFAVPQISPNPDDFDPSMIPPSLLLKIADAVTEPIANFVEEKQIPDRITNRIVPTRWVRKLLIWGMILLLVGFILKWLGVVGKQPLSLSLASLKAYRRKANRINPVLDRAREQLDSQNFYDAARLRVRYHLDIMGGEPKYDLQMPELLIASDARDRKELHAKISEFWELAYGTETFEISPEHWDRLNDDLERIMRLAQRGFWTFAR
ncbi:MAG: hypothetical protein R3B84_13690 [Zavarzinella sp.]